MHARPPSHVTCHLGRSDLKGFWGRGGLVLWVADTDQRRVVVILLLLAGADAEQTQAEAFQGGELGLGQR